MLDSVYIIGCVANESGLLAKLLSRIYVYGRGHSIA